MARKKTLKQLLSREFIRSSLVSLLCVEALLLGGHFFMTEYLARELAETIEQHDGTRTGEQTGERAALLDGHLRTIRALSELLRLGAEQFLRSAPGPLASEESGRYRTTPEGMLYRAGGDGSSAFYSAHSAPGPARLERLARSAELNPLFRKVAGAEPIVVAVYLNTRDSMSRYYPYNPKFHTLVPPDVDLTTYPFYYLADAAHNPGRGPVWTPVYRDPAGQGWMVSCVTPVYVHGVLEGVVGIDATIGRILKHSLTKGLPPYASAMLVDGDGRVIAASREAAELLRLRPLSGAAESADGDLGVEYAYAWGDDPDVSRAVSALLGGKSGKADLSGNGFSLGLTAEKIPETDWRVLVVTDSRRMLASLDAVSRLTRRLGVVAAGVVLVLTAGFVAYLVTRVSSISGRLAQPLEELASASTRFRSGGDGIVARPYEFAELDALSRNLSAMARDVGDSRGELQSMVHSLQEERAQLEEIVHQRTAELVQANEQLRSDIRERERAERDLEERNRFLQTLIDAAPTPIYFKDTGGRISGCNRALEEFMGRGREEIVGRFLTDLLPTEQAEPLQAEDLELIRRGGEDSEAVTLRLPEEEPRDVILQRSTYSNLEGEIIGLVGVFTDVTELRRTARRLEETGELFRGVLEGIQAGIVIIDPKTLEVRSMNPVAEGLFGLTEEECAGRPCNVLGWCDPACRRQECPLQEEVFFNAEQKIENADGKIIPISRTVVTSAVSGSPQLVEILFDITRQKNLERQLTYAQKLESIGQLAAGIAHEINTPTQYVGDNLRFMREGFEGLAPILEALVRMFEGGSGDDDGNAGGDACEQAMFELSSMAQRADVGFFLEEIPTAIGQSIEGVDRVAEIVRGMKKFSHPDDEKKVPLDLNDAIANTALVARNEWKYVAEFVEDFDPTLPLVECLPGDFNQVILNLLVNASHAVGAARSEDSPLGVITASTRRDGDWVEIRIADTGVGIPEANRSKVFNPFFTTKEVGVGTGQGLAITHSIVVDKHGGAIDFETVEARGTTFIIRLPIRAVDADGATEGADE